MFLPKILIAIRGEIACRVIPPRSDGIATVRVLFQADAGLGTSRWPTGALIGRRPRATAIGTSPVRRRGAAERRQSVHPRLRLLSRTRIR